MVHQNLVGLVLMPVFRSLRTRLILPLLLAAVTATTLVAAGSYWLAARTADAQVQRRLTSIATSIDKSDFPLSRNVLVLLSELTSATWVTLDGSGRLIESSAELSERSVRDEWVRRLGELPSRPASAPEVRTIRLGGRTHWGMRLRYAGTPRRGGGAGSSDVAVLLDDSQWREIRFRAAAAPLLTGLATIGLLTAITLWLVGRLVARVRRLQRQVDGIAGGEFAGELVVGPHDELGQLATAVRGLADQLGRMWQELRQRQGQQLLHQVAGGLAHNLRNTLTGARMAIELVQRERTKWPDAGASDISASDMGASDAATKADAGSGAGDAAGLRIALGQLEQAEDYVQRLLLVSRGKQGESRPELIVDCLSGLCDGLGNTARHLGVRLTWEIDREGLVSRRVADGPTLSAAVSNLIWNAMQAGRNVRVEATCEADAGWCRIDVSDDGPGPPADVAETLFDPFVTTKPEGLGLGLSLVRRSADTLGGDASWFRRAGRTYFRFRFPLI